MLSLIFIIPLILIISGFLSKKKHNILSKIFLTIGFSTYIVLFTIISCVISIFANLATIAGFTILAAITLFVFTLSIIWKFKKPIMIVSIIFFIILLIPIGTIIGQDIYEKNLPTVKEPDVLSEYLPNSQKLAKIDTDFEITSDFPKLDGATALYPIYISIANGIYPTENVTQKLDEHACYEITKGDLSKYTSENFLKKFPECSTVWNRELVDCSKTKEAYRKIVDGEADIIFVAGPSKEQEEYAKEKGVELVYTPIGKEAFVFFVNSKNPIEDLSIEQIQDIYSGKITNWKELGIKKLGEIKAFQRAEGSGSQTALQKLMAEKELMIPPQEDVIDLMGGIIDRTADYKNFKNAIGFSFRFYSTEMVKNDQIKLLSLNGVAPTLKNIENGTYPIASEFYAVTRKDSTENTKKLIKWLTTKDAQRIIEQVGYTPISK